MRQETDRALVVKWAAFQTKVATLLGDTQESVVNNQTEEAMKTVLASFRDVCKEGGGNVLVPNGQPKLGPNMFGITSAHCFSHS